MDEALGAIGSEVPIPCDPEGNPELARPTSKITTGWSWPRQSCSPSRRSRPPGAATRRAGGTASRRRRSAGGTPRGSSRLARRACNTQTRDRRGDVHQWVDAYVGADGAGRLLRRALPAEFKPAVDAWVATRPSGTGRPLTPFAMPEYSRGASGGGRAGGQGGGFSRGKGERPASDQLRARSRCLRHRPLLRGDERAVPIAPRSPGAALVRSRDPSWHGRMDRHVPGQHLRVNDLPALVMVSSAGFPGLA